MKSFAKLEDFLSKIICLHLAGKNHVRGFRIGKLPYLIYYQIIILCQRIWVKLLINHTWLMMNRWWNWIMVVVLWMVVMWNISLIFTFFWNGNQFAFIFFINGINGFNGFNGIIWFDFIIVIVIVLLFQIFLIYVQYKLWCSVTYIVKNIHE